MSLVEIDRWLDEGSFDRPVLYRVVQAGEGVRLEAHVENDWSPAVEGEDFGPLLKRFAKVKASLARAAG